MTEFVLQVNAGGAWKTAQKLTDRATALRAAAELIAQGSEARVLEAVMVDGKITYRQVPVETAVISMPAPDQGALKAEYQNQRTATLRRGLVLAERILWGATVVGVIIGVLNAIPMYLDAGGFPGRTNALIFALAWTVIPFVLARAVSEIAASLRT